MSKLPSENSTLILNTHHLSMMASLDRRIKVAKLNQNYHLLEVLEIELEGINPMSIKSDISQSSSSLVDLIVNSLTTLKNSLTDKFTPKTEVQVKELFDVEGNKWWYGFDPKSGQSVYADSDTEMRGWIESDRF